MSSLKDDKKKKGKQSKYVNYKVKELDEEMEENLFGDKTDEIEYDKFDHLVQLGNLRVNRTNFGNPQGTRVYSPKGTCPTVTLAMSTKFLIKDGGEYKIRRLSGFEEMRLMGVDDEDIQKLGELIKRCLTHKTTYGSYAGIIITVERATVCIFQIRRINIHRAQLEHLERLVILSCPIGIIKNWAFICQPDERSKNHNLE